MLYMYERHPKTMGERKEAEGVSHKLLCNDVKPLRIEGNKPLLQEGHVAPVCDGRLEAPFERRSRACEADRQVRNGPQHACGMPSVVSTRSRRDRARGTKVMSTLCEVRPNLCT